MAASKTEEKTKETAAGRRFAEPELAELVSAWDGRDDATLQRVSRRAGVALSLADADAIATVMANLFSRAEVLATIGEALEATAGIAIREAHAFMTTRICLAVTHANALVVAFGHTSNQGDKVPVIWPLLRPWYRDLRRNRARLDTWIANERPDDTYHARGRVALALVPPDDVFDDSARLAELRAAIVATPDDDAPRLVLADLLQQRGDPHGTLIALQCKLARLRGDDVELNEQIDALLATHRVAFAGEVARCATSFELERGFVSRVAMTASSFAAHGARLFAQQPIQTLQLRPLTSETVAKLAATPALACVRHLLLRQEIGAEKNVRWTALAGSRYLAALEILDFQNFVTTERDWTQAFGQLAAPKLRRVELRGDSLSVAALAALAANPNLPMLAELEIYAHAPAKSDRATDHNLFAALAARSRLRKLILENCVELDAAAVRTLFAGPGGRQLRTLWIESKAFDDAALAAMTAMPLELRDLEIGYSPIGDAALAAFVRSPGGARLERIWIHPNCPNLSQDLIDELAKTLPAAHPLRAVALYGAVIPTRFQNHL